MAVIKKRKTKRKITRSFRLRPDLVAKIEKVAQEMGESKTYILESLLEYGLEAYEKEKKGKKPIPRG